MKHALKFSEKIKVLLAKNRIGSFFIFTPSHLRILLRKYEDIKTCFECFSSQYRLPELFQTNHDFLIVDVGANKGFASLSIIDQLLTRGTFKTPDVIAIEPNDKNCNSFELNMKCNGIFYDLYRAVCSKDNSQKRFLKYKSTLGKVSGHGAIKRSVNLDFCIANTSFYPRSSFYQEKRIILKIDCEGSECDVLEGGRNTIRLSDLVFIEAHSIEKRNYCVNFMQAHGFSKCDEVKSLGKSYKCSTMTFVNGLNNNQSVSYKKITRNENLSEHFQTTDSYRLSQTPF